MKKIVASVFMVTLLLSTFFIWKSIVTVKPTTATASISVYPLVSKAEVLQTFTIDLNISDVFDLYGWEFKLRWNRTFLKVLNVIEGAFLRQSGDTFFTYKTHNGKGYILVDCILLGDELGVSGNGTLASVEFYVEVAGESILDLYDTILINSREQPITHTSIDGYYYTPVHDVAVIDLAASETTVLVTVENQGTETETFDVSAYYIRLTDPLIGTQTITLTSEANTTLIFSWIPSSTGPYKISAEANTVSGETDTSDNTRIIIISIR